MTRIKNLQLIQVSDRTISQIKKNNDIFANL